MQIVSVFSVRYSEQTRQSVVRLVRRAQEGVDIQLLLDTILYLSGTTADDESVLVFLPGWQGIRSIIGNSIVLSQ